MTSFRIEPGEDEPDLDRESIADQVIAWRPEPLTAVHSTGAKT
jgi:hypothetical protein